MTAVTAGLRLDEALRGFMAEQGTKHMRKDQLWRLIGGSLRLRLTAHAVAGLPPDTKYDADVAAAVLGRRVNVVEHFYEQLAAQVGRPHGGNGAARLDVPTFGEDELEDRAHSRRTIWLCEHLDHLTDHLGELVEPAAQVAEVRRRPWWR
jgi:hypothetical protein